MVLQASVDDVGSPGFDVYTGAGRINAARALAVESVPTVEIISPVSWDTFAPQSRFLNIVGTAAGANFKQYELSYGQGLAPDEWIMIGEPVTQSVTDASLGIWEIGGLATGLYTLRLVATTVSGFQFRDVVQVAIEILPIPIVTNPADQFGPVISGGRIVWQDNRGGSWDIYLYDLVTKREWQITTNPMDQRWAFISGDRVIWQDDRNGNLDIYLYDFVTKEERQITANPAHQWWAAISGNRIVWQDDRNSRVFANRLDIFHDIYLYDLVTKEERRITDNMFDQSDPAISGDRIVWQDDRNGNSDIYLYDLSTGEEQQITTDLAEQVNPAISGDWIVWTDNRNDRENGNWDIYLYDLVTKDEWQITAHPSAQVSPAIFGNQVVWVDWRFGNPDIFYAAISTDLVMTQISGPASAATGTKVGLVNTVKNQGVSNAGSFYVSLYLSTDTTITTADIRVGTRLISSSLSAGGTSSATTSVTIPAALSAGTYYIGAIADCNNTQTETDETNNALTGNTIVLTIGADLVVSAINGPSSATRGTSIGVSSTVKNQGTGSSSSFTVGLYASTDAVITTADTRIGTRSVASLAAGASSSATTNVTIPSTAPVGTYYIGAIADYNNTALENNETNNARAGNTIMVK